MAINETDVKLFVDSWKQGVLDIKNVYDNKGDYQEQASKFLKTHYLFETESVLFKPTLTREEIFRNSFDRALSKLFLNISSRVRVGLNKTLSVSNK